MFWLAVVLEGVGDLADEDEEVVEARPKPSVWENIRP